MAGLVGLGVVITAIDILLQRNRTFAEGFENGHLKMMSTINALVITCADARVNPSDFMGLNPGEVPVLRSVGGRVTKNVLRDLSILATLGSRSAPERRGKMTVIVVHHNDCGSVLMTDPKVRELISDLNQAELDALAIDDPMTSVTEDLELIRCFEAIPEGTILAGYVYNEKTGELVEAAAPRAISRS